jgi:VanZ family protein
VKIKVIRVIEILIVLIWMITVFNFSREGGEKSSSTSRGLAEEIVNVVTNKKEITREEKENIIEKFEPILRKCAHYTLYLVGGILILNCFNTYNIKPKKKVIFSAITGMLYACTDEIHQYFVPGRSAKFTDVLIDTMGVLTGILIFCIVKKLIKDVKEYIRRKKIIED